MFSGTHKEYQIAEHVQTEMRAKADQSRLAQTVSTETDEINTDYVVIRRHLHWAVKGAFIILTIVVLLVAGQQAFADGPDRLRVDAGNDPGGKPIADYREGRYYLNHGEYELAVEKFTAAIDALPEVLFEMPGYADMYWFLGEAQEGAGMYREALVSYQTFLDLVGESASQLAIDRVEAFSIKVNSLLAADTQI